MYEPQVNLQSCPDPQESRSPISGMHFESEMIEFLARCSHPSILGRDLGTILEHADEHARLDLLLASYGLPGNLDGLIQGVASALRGSAAGDWKSVQINGQTVPHALSLRILELTEPGDELIDIRTVAQLETLLGRRMPADEQAAIQEVLERFPVRLSRHSIRQLRLSSEVGRQYLPFVDELNRDGLVNTWVGQFHSGVIERMYQNRVIMVLNMACPVYCRFCFRKHKECRQESPPTRNDVVTGVEYIGSCPEITEVVLTGGDPFMNRVTLSAAIDGLLEVPHLQYLRVATRSLSYHPDLFLQRDRFWLEYLKHAEERARARDKHIEIATHFIHPDELSLKSLDVIAELSSAGISVYVQSPLLGGINDGGDELVELYSRLRYAGAEIHYVFMPCSPLQGNRAYQSSLDDGLRLAARLRSRIPDRAMPKFCTATAFGKIDWGSNGWAVEADSADDRYLWLRTPYRMDTFASFTEDLDLSTVARPNSDGTLDARFMVAPGDAMWLRSPSETAAIQTTVDFPALDSAGELERAIARFESVQKAVGMSPLQRVHLTRAELDSNLEEETLEQAIATLREWNDVCEVVLHSPESDPLSDPVRLERLLTRLDAVPGINAIRIRSETFSTNPENLPEDLFAVLGSKNRLDAVNPLRLEVEINIRHHSQLSVHHKRAVARLRRHGIAVYNSTLLLAGINLDPGAIRAISSTCREFGIEFHHLVTAGDPAQMQWNAPTPITFAQIIEIASSLRRIGSGRELPRYIVKTPVGEYDFNLNIEACASDDKGQAILRVILPALEREKLVAGPTDEQGYPLITMPGLSL